MSTRIDGDTYVDGAFSAKQIVLPAGAAGDNAIAPLAGIQASKLQHQHRAVFAQNSNANAAAQTVTLFVAVAAGVVNAVKAGAIVVALTTATATVDVKKNGTSILSAPISLTSSQTARQLVAGTVTTTPFVAGDVFEVVVTASAGGGTLAQGIFAYMDVTEAFQ